MAYSSGKHAYGICDRTGFRYPIKELVFEIQNGVKTGLKVGYDIVDSDHPQNFLGRIKVSENESILDARPDRVEPLTERILNINPFTTAAAADSQTVITVKELSHGRSTNDQVRFRNTVAFDGITVALFELAVGYAITKITDDTYTFQVSGSSTTGSVTGGGEFVSAGPVTLEA
tara:strand:- start:1153 stop:1674 length:522 start_codon:yes stop_codon:yes gene_type:complete